MSTRTTVVVSDLERWVRVRLTDDTAARLFLVYLHNLFTTASDRTLMDLLDKLLDRRAAPTTPLAVQQAGQALDYWSPVFLQLKRSGVSGTDALACFTLILDDGISGTVFRTFWTNMLGRTGGSEAVVGCIQQLNSRHNGLTGSRILFLISAFGTGQVNTDYGVVHIRLSKVDLLTSLTCLRVKLDPMQIRKFCRFFQSNFTGAAFEAGNRFRTLCTSISRTGRSQQSIMQLVSAHGTLTDGDLVRLLLECDFEYCMNFLTTALPIGITLPGGVGNAIALVAWVIPQANIAAVVTVFNKAHAADVPIGSLVRLFCHLQHMTAGDRVARLGEFIDRAEVARKTHDQRGRDHTWPEVMNLIATFVTDQRVTNGPTTAPSPPSVNVGTQYCTSERITYFLKAHTYRYFDFSIVNRSRDDITLFPSGTGGGGMRTLVSNVLGNTDPTDAQGNTQMTISTVDYGGSYYEVGLIGQNGSNQVGLLHFMPFTADAGAFWHKTLLTAIGRLF